MSSLHPVQASPEQAESAFGFLGDLGFRLQDRLMTGGESFKDGWRLRFCGPAVDVVVQYLEMQFEVLFCRGDSQASYLFLDKHLFGAKSGYHGDMFPPEKLGAVIAAVASDIRREYGSILSGNEARWADIQRLIAAPPVRRKLP